MCGMGYQRNKYHQNEILTKCVSDINKNKNLSLNEALPKKATIIELIFDVKVVKLIK